MFVHLHGYSHYSLLEAIGSPAKIIEKAKSLGMDSIGIADYGDMYGSIEFYLHSRKQGIKSIIGVQMDIVDDLSQKNKDMDEVYCLLFLARDSQGYKNLIQITSVGNTVGFFETPRVDIKTLQENAKGVILILGGGNDIISKMILSDETDEKINEMLKVFINIYGKENLFLEIVAQDYDLNPKFKKLNDKFVELAKQNNLKMIVGNTFKYINKEDKEAFEILGRMRDMESIASHDHEEGNFHILSEEEMIQLLMKGGFSIDFIDELVTNNYDIAQSVNVEIPLGKIFFPDYQSPLKIKEIYEEFGGNFIAD